MRVLWILNMLLPEAEAQLSGNGEIKSSGGWLHAMANAIVNTTEDVELYTAAASQRVAKLVEIRVDRVTHYVFPNIGNDYTYEKKYEEYWKTIIKKVRPDVVHIHGTECAHSLSCLRIFPNLNYVVSIQGLVTEIAKHYCDGLDYKTILRNITFRDICRKSILGDKKSFNRRGYNEITILKTVKHVIGRTTWDKAVVESINPDVIYHIGNESLREEFYSGCWEYEKCNKHSIFLSQVNTPYKGFHQLLKALPIVIQHFPDVTIRIAGDDVTKSTGDWKDRLKLNNYGSVLLSMIHDYSLKDKIAFLGRINAKEMKNELLKANVFISCSSIENSPNSLGEAQLLGVPCIASYVGGVPDMVPNDNCGKLYRFDDYQLLAYYIVDVFDKSNSFDNTIMKKTARERHDRNNNVKDLLSVYHTVVRIQN